MVFPWNLNYMFYCFGTNMVIKISFPKRERKCTFDFEITLVIESEN